MRQRFKALAAVGVVLAALGGAVPSAVAAERPGQEVPARQATVSSVSFVRTVPVALLNTYYGIGGVRGAVAPGRTLRLQVAGRAGVPQEATAVRLTIGAAGAGMAGTVTAYAHGGGRPALATVAYPAHQASSSEVLVTLGRDGAVDVTNVSGRGFLSVEVEGYETSTPTPGGLVFLPEEWFTGYPRQWLTVLDTVMGQGEDWHAHRIGPGASLRVQAVPAPSDPENGWKCTTGYGARLA